MWAGWLTAVTVLVTGYFRLPLDRLGPDRPTLSWTVFITLLAGLALLLLRQIRAVLLDRRDARPGLVIPFLMSLSVLVFSGGYHALARAPGEFVGLETRLDALYFTVVTLATVGYGDITPQGQTARLVTIVQILYSFVFLTAGATAFSRRVRGVLAHHLGRDGL
nr:potassium channel family protein [Streptomyces sp. MUM 203J]